jgi:hypothetical protein
MTLHRSVALFVFVVSFQGVVIAGNAKSEVVKPVDALVRDLSVADWSTVQDAKVALESLQAQAIPSLVAMMKDHRRVPLTSTADLIYPGAKTFYGHGYIVDYDLDFLPVRAGWALEELTFQDFAFHAGQIDHKALLQYTIQHGFGDQPLQQVAPPRPTDEDSVAKSVSAATEWWKGAGAGWSRLAALREALASSSARRQMAAFQFLRFGKTRCTSLDTEAYEATLLPLVQKLSETGADDVREQAKYLLKDGWKPK